MKLNRNWSLALASLVMFQCPFLLAGSESGNGGGAYVCRNSAAKISSAEVVDLWEGMNLRDLNLAITKTNEVPAIEQARRAVLRLHDIHPPFMEMLLQEMGGIWQAINEAIERGDSGTYLSVVPDSLDIERPKHCPMEPSRRPEYEQVINYVTDNDIRIDVEIFQKLDTETDRAAIAVHEAIYKILRDSQNETNSRTVRIINAYLFSSQPNHELSSLLRRRLTGTLSVYGISRHYLKNKILEAIRSGDLEAVRKQSESRLVILGSDVRPIADKDAFNEARLRFQTDSELTQAYEALLPIRDTYFWSPYSKLPGVFSEAYRDCFPRAFSVILSATPTDAIPELFDGIAQVGCASVFRTLIEDARVNPNLPVSPNYSELPLLAYLLSEMDDSDVRAQRKYEILQVLAQSGRFTAWNEPFRSSRYRYKDGCTPLQVLAHYGSFDLGPRDTAQASEYSLKSLQLLLAHGADLNSTGAGYGECVQSAAETIVRNSDTLTGRTASRIIFSHPALNPNLGWPKSLPGVVLEATNSEDQAVKLLELLLSNHPETRLDGKLTWQYKEYSLQKYAKERKWKRLSQFLKQRS